MTPRHSSSSHSWTTRRRTTSSFTRWASRPNDALVSIQCLASDSWPWQNLEATAKAVTIHFSSYSDCTFPTQNCEDQWETEVHFEFSAESSDWTAGGE